MRTARKRPAADQKSEIRNQKSMTGPLRFTPFLRPMVWGGRRLAEVLGKELPANERYGESWEISDHALHRSVVSAGPKKGRNLRDLMEQDRSALLGPRAQAFTTFPWLIKFLDANDWLSVQVHPDEPAAERLCPEEGSKTEAWFVLDAAPGSRIYAGLLPGTDEAKLRAALAMGTVAECLHFFEPRAGDCVFLPAGTVHAVGGGVLMAEVQQTSDATFRLFDWNRRDTQGKSRKLHIEEALVSIHWNRGPVEPIRTSGFRLAAPGENPAARIRQSLVQCPYFGLEYRREAASFHCGGEGRLQLLIAIQGRANLAMTGQEESIKIGQAWLFPAAMPVVECQPDPELGFLFCTLP